MMVAAAVAAALALALASCGSSPSRTAAPAKRTPTAAILTSGPQATGSATGAAGTITTQGVGTINGTPDTLTIDIDVSTTALHAAGALAHNNAVAATVQQALERDGVTAANIQTTGLSLQPPYPPGQPDYQVDDSVTATLQSLARAGTVIDDAVAAAGDAGRLDGVNLSISDTSPYLAAARTQAVVAAHTEAEQLAAAAGERLGALVSLSDQPQQSNDYLPEGTFAGASAGATSASATPVPVQPGTQQLTVDVTGVWAVAPAA